MVGVPGAGKTTLAHNLSTLLQAEHLRGDKIGLELFRFPTFSPQERQAVHQEMSYRAADHLSAGRHVLYDAATNTADQREAIAAVARQNGAHAVGLWVRTPLSVAKKRAGQARDSGISGAVVRVIPPHVFDQYVVAFEAPDESEDIIMISGDANFYLQYRRLLRSLQQRRLVRLRRLV
jgi:predicted kinase